MLGAWLAVVSVVAASCGTIAKKPGGGQGGSGGSAGGGPATSGHVATEVVTTGHVLTSTHFKMISSVGSRSVVHGETSSANARARSGLVPQIGGE